MGSLRDSFKVGYDSLGFFGILSSYEGFKKDTFEVFGCFKDSQRILWDPCEIFSRFDEDSLGFLGSFQHSMKIFWDSC